MFASWRSGFIRVAALGVLAAGAALAVPVSAAPGDDAAACYKASGDAAIASCTRLIESGNLKNPVLALLYAVRGSEWSQSKEQHDRAIADFDQAIELDPRLAQAHYGRGDAYRAKGDTKRAIADYDKAIGLSPKLSYAYIGRGLAHWQIADLGRAIADFDKAIALRPRVASVYFHRGNVHRVRNDNRRALADYDQAIRLNPNLEAAYINRGLVHLRLGQYERAIADYNVGLRSDQQRANPLFGRGVAKLRNGDIAGGNADLTAAKAIESGIDEEFQLFGVLAVESRSAEPISTEKAIGPKTIQPAAMPAVNCAAAETHWKSAEQIKTLLVYEDHLARFATCDFAGLAAARIQSLKK